MTKSNFKKRKVKQKILIRAKEATAFLNDAFHDYLSSRVLMNQGLIVPSAIFASTCLEKYLKALMTFNGDYAHGHLKKAHWNSLKNYDKEISKAVNVGFLKLCQKCFLLRYTESLKTNFNIVLASREFLAELDYTVHLFKNSFSLIVGDRKQEMRYDHSLRVKDHRLFLNNHILQNITKNDFIYKEPQRVYELRNDQHRGIIEIEYSSTAKPEREGFNRSGAVTTDSTSFQLAFKQTESA